MSTIFNVHKDNIVQFSDILIENNLKHKIVEVCEEEDTLFIEISLNRDELKILHDLMEYAEEDDSNDDESEFDDEN